MGAGPGTHEVDSRLPVASHERTNGYGSNFSNGTPFSFKNMVQQYVIIIIIMSRFVKREINSPQMRSVVVLILCTYFWIYFWIYLRPPDAQILHLWGVSLLWGPGPTRGTGNSNTVYNAQRGRSFCRALTTSQDVSRCKLLDEYTHGEFYYSRHALQGSVLPAKMA